MRYKLLTTSTFVVGILLALGWPLLMQERPPRAIDPQTREAATAFATMTVAYAGLTTLAFWTSACLAMVVVIDVREEFKQRSVANLKDLIAGSLVDAESKSRDENRDRS